jgi:hypothetical protein
MKSHVMAAIVASTALIGASSIPTTASAQPMQSSSSGGYFVPVVIGAAAGATLGALLWPAMVPAGMMMGAGPGAMAAAGPGAAAWGWGAFYTTRAAVGAVIGGVAGYLIAR